MMKITAFRGHRRRPSGIFVPARAADPARPGRADPPAHSTGGDGRCMTMMSSMNALPPIPPVGTGPVRAVLLDADGVLQLIGTPWRRALAEACG